MAATTEKEAAYDEHIAPLVMQVLKLCRKHGICMLAHFDISGAEDPQLLSSSQIPDGDDKWSELIAALPSGFLRGNAAAHAVDKSKPGFRGHAARKEMDSWES